MATSTNTYGETTGVERLIGDIVNGRAFSTASSTAATIPTLAQVELELDAAAASLNVELMAAGYSAPVSTGDPITRRWLQSVNEKGAAATLLGTMPSSAFAPEADDAGTNRMATFQRDFNSALKRIREQRIVASRGTSRLGRIYSGSQESSDANRKLPLFRRGLHSDPENDSLTE